MNWKPHIQSISYIALILILLIMALMLTEWSSNLLLQRTIRNSDIQHIQERDSKQHITKVKDWVNKAITHPEEHAWIMAQIMEDANGLSFFIRPWGSYIISDHCMCSYPDAEDAWSYVHNLNQTGIPSQLLNKYLRGESSPEAFLLELLHQDQEPCFDLPLAVALLGSVFDEDHSAKILNLFLKPGTNGFLKINHAGKTIHVDVNRSNMLKELLLSFPNLENRISWLDHPDQASGISLKVGHMNRQQMLLELKTEGQSVKFLVFGFISTVLLVAVGFIWLSRRKINMKDQKRILLMQAAHQLKTPVASLQILASALSEGMVKADHRAKEYAQAITHQSQRMAHTINQLLQLVAQEKTVCSHINLLNVVERLILRWEHEKRLHFVIEDSDEMENYRIWIHADQFSRAIDAMIDNALLYSDHGVHVNIQINKALLVLQISDKGAGVDLNGQSSLFEAFSRGQTGKARHSEGCGLGLALAKRVIDEHHGTLYFEKPHPGFNTSLRVTLPVKQLPVQN